MQAEFFGKHNERTGSNMANNVLDTPFLSVYDQRLSNS